MVYNGFGCFSTVGFGEYNYGIFRKKCAGEWSHEHYSTVREEALQFYKNKNFEIVEKTYILLNEIQHWRMRKELER